MRGFKKMGVFVTAMVVTTYYPLSTLRMMMDQTGTFRYSGLKQFTSPNIVGTVSLSLLKPSIDFVFNAVTTWKNKVVSFGGSINATEEDAHLKFVRKLKYGGNSTWDVIEQISTFSGDNANAAATPIKISATHAFSGKDLVRSVGTGSTPTYNRAGGFNATNVNVTNGGCIDTGVKLNNTITTNGTNAHIGVFTLQHTVVYRNMGVFRNTSADRHYLVCDGVGTVFFGGMQTYTASNFGPGLLLVTRGTSTTVLFYNNTTAYTCSGSADNTAPSDWTVTVNAAHGSNTGVSGESELFHGFASARYAGYVIGRAISSAQVEDIRSAFVALNTDIGRS